MQSTGPGDGDEQLSAARSRAGRWEHCRCHVSVMNWKNAICGGVLVNVSRVRLYFLRTEESCCLRRLWMGEGHSCFQSSYELRGAMEA